MSFHLKVSSLVFVFLIVTVGLVSAQEATPTPEAAKTPEPTNIILPTNGKGVPKEVTAEQVVESTILVYAFPGGRVTLTQIRKSVVETGKRTLTTFTGDKASNDKTTENTTYSLHSLRGETSAKDKIRVDTENPSAKFSLVWDDGKVFGVFRDKTFDPIEEATAAFKNQYIYSLETLLRYKENESKLEIKDREKILGVDFYVIDLTDKDGHKMRFYISVKTFRVMILDFENQGVNYRRRFYNYNYAQGTLVPFRTVLYANDRIVEETDIGTITYGQKVDESLFLKP